MRRPDAARLLTPDWSVFRKGGEAVAVPRMPLLIRLRRVVGEEYFEQGPLAPLKRFMEAVFVLGPCCILGAYYLPRGGGLLTWFGIACLAIASLYWFAPHFLCRLYLSRRGYALAGTVAAGSHEAALAMARTPEGRER